MITRLFFVTLFALALHTATWGRPDTFAYVPHENGTITRFRVDNQTGALLPLPGETDTGFKRMPTLVVSADGRFLYAHREFSREDDGVNSEEIGNQKRWKVAEKKPTPIAMYAIEPNGGLHRAQSLSVPGLIGQLVPHPGGRFVYALTVGGAFVLSVKRDGRLENAGRVDIPSGMGLYDVAGERDAWGITWSPSGKYLYDFRGDGFVDHAENYLTRYRVNPATGKPTADGKEWSSWNDKFGSVSEDPGAVWYFANSTAFVKGFGIGFWVCRVDTNERILSEGSRLVLKPQKQEDRLSDSLLTKHPKSPLMVYRGGRSEPYSLWRVVSPGKIKQIGAFASAMPERYPYRIIIEPSGRFVYEIAHRTYDGKPFALCVYALNETATAAIPTAPPKITPNLDTADIVFVVPKPK